MRVPLLSELAEPDRDAIARLFTERTFAAGETVTKEGADAAAFYLIESGTATVTADVELVCQGITLWDFQPLVQRNPTMAWTLLQTLAGMLRQTVEPERPA